MIELHRTKTERGEVAIILHRHDGTIGYYKDGHLQTLIDMTGRNLAPYIEAAAQLMKQDRVQRALVLGHGGGAVSTLLHQEGIDVVAVDIDPGAADLARRYFHAPVHLNVITSDAASFVRRSPVASFDAAFVDFEDSDAIPVEYSSAPFWRDVNRAVRPPGKVVVNITSMLHDGPGWNPFQHALAGGGLGVLALTDEFWSDNRLLIAARAE
ncbi:MAG: methyltransferase domain-containing protein [Caulobacteraceae bacterium]